MTTLMWEARAADGRIDDLVEHLRAHTDPDAQIYRSVGLDERVVVIDSAGRGIADVPSGLLARAPHTWSFTEVAR